MDELRCHEGWRPHNYEASNRCKREATWVIKVNPRVCGHSWLWSEKPITERPEQTQLYCEQHVLHYVDWFMKLGTVTCNDCGSTTVPRDSFVTVERL